MKKWFLVLVLALVVSGTCFAQQPIENDFLKVRKVVSEKMTKVRDKKFAAFKYLLNPNNKLSHVRDFNGAAVFLGEYPDGKGDGSYSPILLFITFLPESKGSIGMIALQMRDEQSGGLMPIQTIMFDNGKFILGDIFSNESIDL